MFHKATIFALTIVTYLFRQVEGGCNTETLIIQSEKNGYKYTKNAGLHKIFTVGKTWAEANQTCVQKEGGHLAIINSQIEELVLVNMMIEKKPELKKNAFIQTLWVGFHLQDGNWQTVDGNKLDAKSGYLNWGVYNGTKQPNNCDRKQNCGALIKTGMDDRPCDQKVGYICELPIEC